jgi:hypothetical protein
MIALKNTDVLPRKKVAQKVSNRPLGENLHNPVTVPRSEATTKECDHVYFEYIHTVMQNKGN